MYVQWSALVTIAKCLEMNLARIGWHTDQKHPELLRNLAEWTMAQSHIWTHCSFLFHHGHVIHAMQRKPGTPLISFCLLFDLDKGKLCIFHFSRRHHGHSLGELNNFQFHGDKIATLRLPPCSDSTTLAARNISLHATLLLTFMGSWYRNAAIKNQNSRMM